MRYFLFVLTVFLYGSLQAQQENGKWYFHSIINDSGDTVKNVSEGDVFILNPDSTFEYGLSAYELAAGGSWMWKGDTLVLSYIEPVDTQRYYVLRELSDRSFRFWESGVTYSFKRELDSASPTTTDVQQGEFYDGGVSGVGILRGLLGLIVLVAIAWIFSANRRKVNWPLVAKGLTIQLIFAIAILKFSWIKKGFEWVSESFVTLLSFTTSGSEFLFGGLINDTQTFGYIFAFQVLPTILFFSALTSLLFYYGILQKIVYGFAWVMRRTMRLSGAESLAAAGNIFLGQTEAPLLVKPYIEKMTRSEIMCLMSGGMATIAGGVLAAYIGFLGGESDADKVFFAKHLLAASVMSAPAAVVAAKILVPETEKVNANMEITKERIGKNALEAISNGTLQGLKLAVNVGAMLLVFIALIAMVNYILGDFLGQATGLNGWIASFTDGRYNSLSLEFILGYSLAPITWLMGVPAEDMVLVGQLLGEKTILNEFVAYVSLGDMKSAGMFTSHKSVIIATYILCGFSNFASIGIQIGGIGALAPNRRGLLSELGIRALIGGTLASLFTAVIVGMLI